MRNVLRFALVFTILVFAIQASAQTVDEVINKNIQAHGGLEKLKAAKSVKMTGKMILPGGVEAPIVYEKKRPSSIRIEFVIQGLTGIQAYDGQTAWQVMPFQGIKDAQKMSEEDAKDLTEEADFDGPLVDYKAKGNTVELVGKEDLEGSPAYKLKLTLKSGDVRYLYIDAENWLELKQTSIIKREGKEASVDTFLSDYKPVNGLVFAHSIEVKAGGQAGPQYVVDKIEMDSALDDSLFKMPSAAQSQP